MPAARAMWYLSFAGPEGFRGVLMLEAIDFLGAVERAHELALSPGGEVKGWRVPEEWIERCWAQRDRLLQRDELVALGHRPRFGAPRAPHPAGES